MIATLFDVAHQIINTSRKSLIHVYIFKMMKLPISGLVPELNHLNICGSFQIILWVDMWPAGKTQIHFDHFMISNVGPHYFELRK